MYEKLATAANAIRFIYHRSPQIGLVLGSGLGPFIDHVENPCIIPYGQIPYFGQTTVEGHEGRMIMGQIRGVEVAILQGRLHVYEGPPIEDVVFSIRTLATLGIESLLLTNAAGGINKDFTPGDLVVIKDHINLQGINPLVGPNISEFGPRFPDMTQAYCSKIQEQIHQAANQADIKIKEGVYCAVLGPTYETPAEVKMISIIGGDMVGMSTVPECIAANHLGLKVGGISCITNMAAGLGKTKLDHAHVKEQASLVMERFSKLLLNSIELIGKQSHSHS